MESILSFYRRTYFRRHGEVYACDASGTVPYRRSRIRDNAFDAVVAAAAAEDECYALDVQCRVILSGFLPSFVCTT